ncbi:MAG: chain length-determining protein, partial [Gammaproteobacteria bacterium]
MFREVIDQLLAAIRGAWRYRWLALSLAWGIAMAGWLWVLMLPDEYEAKTQVYVDTESALLPLVEGLAVRTDVMTEVNMMTVVLVSRPQLERVARDTDLDLRATDAREWEMLIRELRKRIRIGGDARRNLYEIQYYDEDRDMALKVVRSLLNVFVEDTLGETTQDN